MRFTSSAIFIDALATLTLTTANPMSPRSSPTPTPSSDDIKRTVANEALAQAEYGLAHTLDAKNWTALSNYMTSDVYYDSSALGPGKGGVFRSLDEIIAALKLAWAGKQVAHNVPNSLVDSVDGDNAHVFTYLIFSQWDATALKDPNRTYRIYEQCDDNWVLQDGKWKLKHSIVTNLALTFELPYFG